jgi:alanine racemase
LKALDFNVGLIRRKTRGKIIAVVKQNAYGHGIWRVADRLKDKVSAFAVARAEDAFMLRKHGIANDILMLGGFDEGRLGELIESNITLNISSRAEYRRAAERARAAGTPAKAHIKIDSGMRRLGFSDINEYGALLSELDTYCEITGIYTHFATADGDAEYFDYQLNTFERFLSLLPGRGSILVHAANSAAILRGGKCLFDGVRSGIMLYGYGPPVGQKPVMSVTAEILCLKRLHAGEKLGYNISYTADRDCTAAVLSAGYGDGYPRLVNRGHVMINDRRCPITGTVCMDMMTVDVTDAGNVMPGGIATLLGAGVTAEDIAGWSGTISYDVLTAFNALPFREYLV